MTDPSLDPIFAYLREHSGRYSLSALREHLLQTGHDPAMVDRAIAIYQQENPPALPAPVPVWPKALMVLAVNAALMAVVAKVLVSGASNDTVSSTGFLLLMIGCGELLGSCVLALWQKSRAWGLALFFGLLLSIPLGILASVGLCAYLYSESMRG